MAGNYVVDPNRTSERRDWKVEGLPVYHPQKYLG
jgi:hypothetical protein